MTRALLYLRQSDSDGAGERSLSLESQSSVLHADADRYGWSIVGEIRDADEKGWNDRRPGLLELYQRCEAGNVDLVAFWSLNRLARSVRITENVVHELNRLGVSLYSNQEPWVAEPMMRQVFAAFAEQQTRDTRAHVMRAVREKMQRGIWHGAIPYGFMQPSPESTLEPHPEYAPIVAEMYRQRVLGVGPAAIALDLTRRGIPTPKGLPAWHTATVMHILRHVAHRGAIQAGDQIIEEAHPAIIDADMWQRAQVQSQQGRRGPRRKMVSSWLDGLTEHVCGQPMYLCQPTPSLGYALLRCRDAGRGWRHAGAEPCMYSPRAVKAERIEVSTWNAVVAALETLLDPDVIIAMVQDRYRQDTPAVDAARHEAAERQKRAIARRSRAESLYLSGSRDRAWFDVEDAHAATEVAEADRVLTSLPEPPNESMIATTWQSLRGLADMTALIADQDKSPVLRALGVAVVAPSGIKIPGKGGADQGKVFIRLRPELELFFAEDTRYQNLADTS